MLLFAESMLMQTLKNTASPAFNWCAWNASINIPKSIKSGS